MKQIIFLAIVLCFSFQGCSQNRDKMNTSFIENHGNGNFEKFKNKSLMIRSSDRKEIVVFVFDYSYAHGNSKNTEECGFVRIIVSKLNNQLISSSFIPQSDTCSMTYNEAEYFKLSTEFLQLQINSLSVDGDNNVFVKTTFYEGLPDLLRVNNKESIIDFDQLVLIKENWYKRQ